MVLRRISTDSSLNVRTVRSQITGNEYPLHPGLDAVEESALHMDLARKKSESFKWAGVNTLAILLVLSGVFDKVMNSYVQLIIERFVLTVAACNVLHYGYSLFKLESTAAQQRQRIQKLYSPKEKATETIGKFEPVKFEPKPEETKTYLSELESMYDSFKSTINSTKNISVLPSSDPVPPKLTEAFIKCKGKLIKSARELKQYLSEHESALKDEFVKTSEDSNLNESGNDFWSAGRKRNTSDNVVDVSPILRRTSYQTSPNSSDSSICLSSEMGCTNQEFFDMLKTRYKINSSCFIYWVSNLRMWITKKVLGQVVGEMNLADAGFRSIGLSGLTIGSVALETLTDAVRNQTHVCHQIRQLKFLLPFLKISSKQEYLVSRIKALAKGNMAEFKWNSGGTLHGKPFEKDYPADALILAHVFAAYLDQQLPLSPTDSSKPFSTFYFGKDASALRQNKIGIIEASTDPPHYKLMIDGAIQDVPAGRNNAFYAIILFLCYIKTNNHGMLGRVSLGKHGIDLLWVIDEKDI